jgi:hypothetical protein
VIPYSQPILRASQGPNTVSTKNLPHDMPAAQNQSDWPSIPIAAKIPIQTRKKENQLAARYVHHVPVPVVSFLLVS